MRSAAVILAGLLAGVLVALGVLAAFLFVGPEPVGLRSTPSPEPSIAASASPSPLPSVAASASPSPLPPASASVSPAGSPSGSPAPSASPSPSGSDASQTAFGVGRAAPALVVGQPGVGEIELAHLS